MAKPFIASNKKQAFLFPPSIDDWLPQEHLARYIAEIVEQLNLSNIYRHYSGQGKDPMIQEYCWHCCFTGMPRGYFQVER